MLPREKGRRSRSITASKLTRGVVPKLVRQYILLMLTLLEKKKKMQDVFERIITLGRGVFLLTCN